MFSLFMIAMVLFPDDASGSGPYVGPAPCKTRCGSEHQDCFTQCPEDGDAAVRCLEACEARKVQCDGSCNHCLDACAAEHVRCADACPDFEEHGVREEPEPTCNLKCNMALEDCVVGC